MSLGPNMSLGPSSPEFDKFLMIIVHPENLNKMDQFIDYLRDEWLPKANLWSQDGNNGPRTTNTAEAFHNQLRTHSFSHLHPELNRFIHEIQLEHNTLRRRLEKLKDNVVEADEQMEEQNSKYGRISALWMKEHI